MGNEMDFPPKGFVRIPNAFHEVEHGRDWGEGLGVS